MLDKDYRDRVIVALDCSRERARELARDLQGHARWLKVGMTLYYAAGPSIVDEFKALGFKVFLDLKLHDIPHQVQGAARVLAASGADMLTIHAGGGPAMASAAAGALREVRPDDAPILLGVTVLTSMDAATLEQLGVSRPLDDQVGALASMACQAGCDGVVCSPWEAPRIRELLGPDAAIVTPGVRPKGASLDDQSRVMTPSMALQRGASHIVIGRPVTGAQDPVAAFESIVKDMEEELS
ncbi:MAG: orotidine-5'-phosphate decarboxylase [Coriobacteriales bacterium]|nr:orotidine-5'-phosphate decarboxylase [Coriobacteriales bacterium]